ncbi:EI24 domain-containing protein [Microbacterium dextranolyticum]|uniref:Uncharacterized protein n=1 Tax=Microbacterium dextranolyticum TaxID=36806 RepID=A0A9W6M638_9MICO|nr:EI24 domain-containing protein [Microbacterium dextranolyticum]MBM7463437.1 VIT1/CCC1 family predicted Fe2+/Mn2+ transporter [Microbacterium dextranolyticum]GLJ95461.1 hypothetical protein GCM10017591_15240 [Microbacterium dextranolyticum]
MALPGNPTALAERAATYQASASRIDRAAADLRALAYTSTAKSLDAIRQRSGEVAGTLSEAYGRYAGTAAALVEYAAALGDAHRRADAADAAEATAESYAGQAGSRLDALTRRVQGLEDAAAPLGAIEAAEREVADAQRAARRYDAAASSARDDHEAARREMEAAAQRAMSLIDSAIDATNESWLDHVGNFFAGVGSWLADLGRWVGEFLHDLWDELQRLVSTVLALLGTILILVLVYALLSLIPVIGPLIAALVVGILAGFLLGSILSDVLKPTPKVGEYTRDEREKRQDMGQPRDLSTAIKEAAYVDKLGHVYTYNEDGTVKTDVANESVISVTKVVDADGVVRWRVSLPSTQEWLSRFDGDQGATNDLDSNLALMLTPSLRSQYERAVLDAMKQAGVGPEDPVMLVGFSQGGIMAGTLAAYNSDYNWSAVVVAGAPIDSMPIPSTTQVVSVQHDGDLVPRLDSIISLGTGGYAQHRPNWTTINEPSPLAAEGMGGIHNGAAYNSTLQSNIGQVPPSTRDDLDRYFIGDENAYGYQETYYSWQEK